MLQPTDDSSAENTKLSLQDKHFDVVVNHDKNIAFNNISNASKDLLEKESEACSRKSPAKEESRCLQIDVNLDKSEDEKLYHKRKRTETLDSEIVVIDNNDDSQSIGSGLDSDAEGNDSDAAASIDSLMPKEYDPSIDDRLPDTVTLLTTPDGGKLYLIGTAHFSTESQDDVSNIIQAVQPHIVMVELCKARVHILQLDEKTILQEAENLTFQVIRDTIQQNGPFNGLLYILLLNVSAHLTRELGMAPGGEFRRAFSEAKKIPNCLVHLGDRPINITLQRALSSLGWWQTIKLGWHLLAQKDPISKEEVERCKRRDMLEEMLAEMAGEFPAFGEVFVKERDLYLTHSLQLACLPQRIGNNSWKPSRVVGVVGIGHMRGIIENWGKVQPSEILPIMRIPPPSLSSRILRITIKASLVGAVIYVGYKIIPLPSGLSLQSIKSSVEGLLKCLTAIILGVKL
ncbi:traB domain-containing protein isoform X2 [Venturia canescens]|uniref:traB domain-containing protein isoform X2 n=1 Tax=Venturia canescens TaxID=32260 RepID=UPI001C9C34F9|nr:traB domain-containing protein isoform X2 [Venturia canescens]